jgi:hypothetical protein
MYKTAYFGEDKKCVTPSMAATHATITGLTGRPEIGAHKLYKSNFTLSVLIDNLHTMAINCCGTVGPNQKAVHIKFGQTI